MSVKYSNSNEKTSKSEQEEIIEIEIDKLENFSNHPFKVIEEALGELQLSISENGVTTPLIVRKKENGNYELIAGHRRKKACELLGIKKVPCIVRNLNDYEAIIQMVDTNIQREELLPSEKAFAFKMRLEAIKHQGKRKESISAQVGQKFENTSRQEIANRIRESREQIRRYIRLTELIPEILEMVDVGKIAFTPAVELSYLKVEEQKILYDEIKYFGTTPSVVQAQKLKNLSQNNLLTKTKIIDIMCEEKGNQEHKYEISYKKFRKYIPRKFETPREFEEYLLKCAIICKERGIQIDKINIPLPKVKTKDKGTR